MPSAHNENRSGDAARAAWIFHAGALGDFVLIWPLVRTMARQGWHIRVVADHSKAALIEREFRLAGFGDAVRGVAACLPLFNRLWTGKQAEDADRVEGVERVLSFVCDDTTPAGKAWVAGAASMFPRAAISCIGAPGSESRRELEASFRVAEFGAVDAVANDDGPIVLHVGAGSRTKRWPMDRWAMLVDLLGQCVVLAGEVEDEQFDDADRAVFARLGGVFMHSLADLVGAIRSARVFVGADSGPVHLAAQLGVPCVALFGPTDPALWRPPGPRVAVIAPDSAPTRDMTWLEPERVLFQIRSMSAANGFEELGG